MALSESIGNKPLVSIVTPSYNQGQFIESTLLSVMNQDYPNLEHIVIDGVSTDETLSVLKKYEGRYNLRWVSEPDRGQSEAINKGFDTANGDIIGWINSDDAYFDRGVISYVVTKFQESPHTDIMYGDGIIIDELNRVLRIRHVSPWFNYDRLLRGDIIHQPSAFYRKRVIQAHKLDVNLHLSMDYEYYLRLARDDYRFKHVNRILAAFRTYASAKSESRSQEMQTETGRIRQLYGCNSNVSYQLSNRLDYILNVYLEKVLGARTMVLLCANPRKANLAFPVKFYSPVNGLLRQVWPRSLIKEPWS